MRLKQKFPGSLLEHSVYSFTIIFLTLGIKWYCSKFFQVLEDVVQFICVEFLGAGP